MLETSYIQPFFLNGCIVDFETSGLDDDSEVTCFGYISGGQVRSFIKEEPKEAKFHREAINVLTSCRKPMFAFVHQFEQGIIQDWFRYAYPINEIQYVPFEKKKDEIRVKYLDDPYFGEGKKAVEDWYNYLRTHERSYLWRILKHNQCCLVQELALLICKPLVKTIS